MTTYTLTGFTLRWSDTNGDGDDDTVEVGSTEMKIVLADTDTSFSYSILTTPEDDNELPIVEIAGNNAYNVRLNGDLLGSGAEYSIGEVHWTPGNVGQVMSVFNGGDLNHIFHINGDDLGVETPADVYALDTAGTYFGEVLETGWQAGDIINFADLASASITENDRIYGFKSKDSYAGGVGNDRIWGAGNDDTLNGGKGHDRLFGEKGKDKLLGKNGNDRLYGGDHIDKLYGGKGNDLLDGGSGDDRLNGGKGDDRFVFNEDYGWDTVEDFENNKDTLLLDSNLWDGTLSVAQVLEQFATRVSGEGFDGVALEFNNATGDGIFLNGIGINGLLNDIDIV